MTTANVSLTWEPALFGLHYCCVELEITAQCDDFHNGRPLDYLITEIRVVPYQGPQNKPAPVEVTAESWPLYDQCREWLKSRGVQHEIDSALMAAHVGRRYRAPDLAPEPI